jgi:pimeloyl-ACP methyl ester carboxylesterase
MNHACAVAGLLLLLIATDTLAQQLAPVPGMKVMQEQFKASWDGTQQSLIVEVPDGYDPATPTPLLVGIHTWSAEYHQQIEAMGPECARRGWLLVLPDFRGPNLTSNPHATDAGGSRAAQHDVMDAVAYMQSHYNVAPRRIYILGGSGGGHMTLQMAAKYPDVWAAASAWCPVTDFREWHDQPANGYAPHVAAVCGGKPGTSAAVDFEYLRRSPRTFLTNAANTFVYINHGDSDPVIWPAQTWRTFEQLKGLRHHAEFWSFSGGHDLLLARGMEQLARHIRPEVAPLTQTIVSDEGKWYFWLYVEPDAPLTLAHCQATLHPAAAATDKTPAHPTTLTLKAEHAKVIRVRLADLKLGEIRSATGGGKPLTCSVTEGVLELKPASGAGDFELTF